MDGQEGVGTRPCLTLGRRGGQGGEIVAFLRQGLIFALPMIVLAMGALVEAGPPEQLPSEATRPLGDPIESPFLKTDARLNDVCFVDSECGWAVGDRGTIWHTADGGQTWALQASGVVARLHSVCFLDRSTGWIVGGGSHPYTHTSQGVVLVTRDGGTHWQHDAKLLVPDLRKIGFFSQRQGWALGRPSAMSPSGLFLTSDGGRSWNAVPGDRTAGWVAGDLLSPSEGVVASSLGEVTTLQPGENGAAISSHFGLRGVRAMQLVRGDGGRSGGNRPTRFGWLAGDGGLVLVSADLGRSWQPPLGAMPEGIVRGFDFGALAVRGAKVWIAGTPGTRILYTPDAGRSWALFSTRQNLPIREIAFVDDQRGWAVGDMGTILATTDGGQTWKTQRSGGERSALLGIFGEPADVPLELFAQLSGNEGYLSVVETLTRRDLEVPPRSDADRNDRLHEALVLVGGCGSSAAWQFPLRQEAVVRTDRQVLEGWDWANQGQGLAAMEAYVVREIRTWRPDVLVTHDIGPSDTNPAHERIREVVVEAVRRAADPTAYAEQIDQAGLGPWQVKRVFGYAGAAGFGSVRLSTTALAGGAGESVADVASRGQGFLDPHFRASLPTLSFRLLVDRPERTSARADFFAGIVLQPGKGARRERPARSAQSVDLIRRIAKKRRNTRAILQKREQAGQAAGGGAAGGGAAGGLLAQMGDLTEGLDPESAAQILNQLARRYVDEGNWAMAADVYGRLAQRFPEHGSSRAAAVWLVQYYASGEAAWRAGRGQRFAVKQVSAPAVGGAEAEDRAKRVSELSERIRRTWPDMSVEPAVQFPWAATVRTEGLDGRPRHAAGRKVGNEAERFYLTRSHGPNHDAWWTCARAERWVLERSGKAPKPTATCVHAASKPLLDGLLHEAFWKRAEPARLPANADAAGDGDHWPATVMLAHDAEFLYLAVRAKKAPGAEYPGAAGPRPRDPDLSDRDRVEVFLDLDRDFATFYRLSVDHRGWASDACWGDSTWNPAWFVAAAGDEASWTLEAAIPVEELTGQPPNADTAWAIGIQRVVPGVGFQSWNTPASADAPIPEGFGYLLFE